MATRSTMTLLLAVAVVLAPLRLSFGWTLAGKEVKKGVWRGYEIEYVSGEILLKASSRAAVGELRAALLSQGYTMKREFDKLRCG